MARSQHKSYRKASGGKFVAHRKKRHSDLGRNPALTNIGKNRSKIKRSLGGGVKVQLLSNEFVCVSDEKGKTTKLNILSVVSNPANINYTRRNIITKGCIVKTEKGDVIITSRPGQTGTLFGVLQ